MLTTTKDAIRAMLKADASLTPEDRQAILLTMGEHGRRPQGIDATSPELPRIITRGNTAKMFGRSTRFVDLLAKAGDLQKVRLRGRKRAIGFRLADVIRLIEGGKQ